MNISWDYLIYNPIYISQDYIFKIEAVSMELDNDLIKVVGVNQHRLFLLLFERFRELFFNYYYCFCFIQRGFHQMCSFVLFPTSK